jgi:hypothetical protein
MRKPRRPYSGGCIVLALVSSAAWSQSADTLPADPANSEVVVTAPRGLTSGGIPPLLILSPTDLESYGADTLSDLVDALKPLTRSSRSDQMPVVLINGHLAGQVEFDNLPREAIERVEVLPETVALQYGFSENQRVLNFVLRENYRAVPTRLTESGATEGGDRGTAADASLVRLEDEARITLLGNYRDNTWLRESDRGIYLPDSYQRTLQPAKNEMKLAGTVSGLLLGVSSSLEASLDTLTSKSLQGLAGSNNVPVLLSQDTRDTTGRLAGQLTGRWGRFVWGATGTYIYLKSRASSVTGANAQGDAVFEHTDATLNAGNLQLSLSGRLFSLPAGAVIANSKFGFQYQGFDSIDELQGSPLANSNLVRSVRSGSLNASLPLTSRERGVLPAAGTLSVTLNAALDNVSNFGNLWSFSYGLDWLPANKVHLDAIFTDHAIAPTVQQVLSPPLYTPNTEMFDFVSGQTVYVTAITGGGGNLRAAHDRLNSFGLSLGPVLGKTVFSAHYEQHRMRDTIGELPPLTADVEQAFPERFVRNAQGTLILVDNRWVNLDRQDLDDLKWGFNVWVPLGAQVASQPSPSRPPSRLEISLFDTWYLHDTVLIRNGIPVLDLLNGAPADLDGGQSRHRIELRALFYKSGVGIIASGAWRSATTVGTGDPSVPDALHFSAIGTAELRTFADLEQWALTHDYGWSRGLRTSLVIANVFDRRQSVRDDAGMTPSAFAPGYLDSPGRTVWFTVRKVF